MQRRLGAGAFGVVYEAFDRRDETLVALKVLRLAEPEALYDFKRSFRSLAELRHPNLCSYYELHEHEGLWFLSMEKVTGEPITEVLAREDRDGPDPVRVWQLFRQLAAGLQALHAHGKLHRDIKPANVLVTAEDRVVLLDFGLVAELGRGGTFRSRRPKKVGTPVYVSPEQWEGGELGPASDWYSVGVMLHQVLSGETPAAALPGHAWSPRDLSPDLPADLAELVRGLLEPDPMRRLQGRRVLALLGQPSGDKSGSAAGPPPPFVGRRELLESLSEAYLASRGGTVAALLGGDSGVGKSALARRFLDGLGDDALVLAGRCFPRETVPYQALDSLIDDLSRHLLGRPRHELTELLRYGGESLACLFPVFGRIPGSAGAERCVELEPQEVRLRAIDALRALLGRLSRERPLVLFIDDLQWGDADSFLLLEDLLRGPARPPLLLLACHRGGAEELGSAFAGLERALGRHASSPGVVRLWVPPLGGEEARRLARALSPAPDAPWLREALGHAAGNPFLIGECTRSTPAFRSGRPHAIGGDLSSVLLHRIRCLPASARSLLEVVAVAGGPLAATTARLAAGSGEGFQDDLGLLLDERLLALARRRGEEQLELYHDRLRQVVLSSLPEERSRTHNQLLAKALESSGRADAGTLAMHFRAIREVDRAVGYAAAAARRAERALAFEHAVRLYRMALDLLGPEAPDRFSLEVRLGHALANAGRSREAAAAYLQAVKDSGTIDPHELQRDAAEKLLVSGHIDRGLSVLRHVMRALGMQLEARPWKVLRNLWWWRAALWLRGGGFRERPESEVSAELLRRIDICWSVEIGLCLVDVPRASEFHARHLYLALSAGEKRRIARGLAMEIFFSSMDGRVQRKAEARALSLAAEVPGSYARSLTLLARAMRSCQRGDWAAALGQLERAARDLGASGEAVAWELATARHFQVQTMVALGRYQDLFQTLPGWLRSAEEASDLYSEIHLRTRGSSLRLLAGDEPGLATAEADHAIARWSHEGYHYQHFGHLLARVQAALYAGRGRHGWELLERGWRRLEGSMIQRLVSVLVESHDLRARAATAALADGGGEGLLAEAERSIGTLELAAGAWSRGLAALARAGLASLGGPPETALAELERAEERFAAADMRAHLAVARLRRGELAGPAGEALVGRARAELGALGIRSPRRWAAMLAPGRWPSARPVPAPAPRLQ